MFKYIPIFIARDDINIIMAIPAAPLLSLKENILHIRAVVKDFNDLITFFMYSMFYSCSNLHTTTVKYVLLDIYLLVTYIWILMKLITKIKPQRRKTGLTQADLAAEVGVSRQTIISIEKGSCVPSTFLALRLAKVLDKPVEELFTITD